MSRHRLLWGYENLLWYLLYYRILFLDVDALVSIKGEEHLANLIEEYDISSFLILILQTFLILQFFRL